MSKTLAFELRIEGLAGQIDRIAELESELHQTKEMLKLFKKEGEDFRGVLSQMEKLKLALKEERSELAKNNAELKKSAEGTKTLMNAQVSMSQTERQWQAENRKMLQEENRLKKEIAARRKADVEQAIRDNEIEKKSLIGMRLELERMKKEYYTLSEAQRNSTMGRNMLKGVQRQNAAVSSIEQSVGVYSRNVGNYPLAQAGNMVASNLTGGILGNGAMMGAVAAVAAAVELSKEIVTINKEVDKLQANIRKVAGMNTKEVEDLTAALKQIDTPKGLDELLNIAEIGGRFGVTGVEGLSRFTKAINLVSIALGDNFSGGVENITRNLSQLSNVLYGNTTNGDILAERLGHLGNVINILDQSSSATAEEITDMGERMGATGRVLGFTAPQILGTATLIKELGINVELGSTAFNRIQRQARAYADEFSKVLKMNKKDLLELLDKRPFEATQQIIQKIFESGEGSNTKVIANLKKLKLAQEGVSTVVLALGKNTERWNDMVELGQEGIENTNSLLAEQKSQMDSVSYQVDRIHAAWQKLVSSEDVQHWLTGVARGMGNMLQIFTGGEKGDGLNYAVDKFATWFFSGFGTQFISDYFAKRGKAIENRVLGKINAAPIDDKFTKGLDFTKHYYDNIAGSILNPANQPQTKQGGSSTGGRGGGGGKPKKTKTPNDYGAVDSITYMKQQVSELEAKMNKTDPKDTAKIQGYIKAIDELNAKINAANEELEYQKKLFAAKDRVTPGDLPTIEGKTSGGIVQSDKDKKKQHEQEYQEMVDFNNRISKNNQEQTEKEKREEQNKRNFIIDSTSQTINQLTDLWDAYNERRTQKDLDALDALYEKKLAAAQGNATLEKALAEEQAREREKIEKKARKKSQDMAILQANINGALAITEIWANTVDPTPFKGFKIAATVMAGLQTAMQIAIIKAQSFAEGGFTGPGMGERDETGHRVAGVVHEDEYVAPKSQIARYPALFQSLERDRVANYKPFARGGFTTSAELPPMPMPYQQGMGEGGMITFARIVAAETFEAVKAGAIIGAQESNRIAERETIVSVNKVR